MTLKDNNDGTFSIVAPCNFDKPKQLTDDELHQIFRKYFPRTIFSNGFKQFARDAIEKAHGIQNSVE